MYTWNASFKLCIRMRSRSLDSKRLKLRSLAFSWPFRRLKLVTLRPRDVRVVVAPPQPLVSSLCELESVISGSNSCTCYTNKWVLFYKFYTNFNVIQADWFMANAQTNKQTNLLHFFCASFWTNWIDFFFVGRCLILTDIRVSE